MNRREFIRSLGMGAAAVAAAPLLPFVATPAPVSSVSMRFIQNFDLVTDRMPSRLDVLYGVAPLRPDFAVRAIDG